MFYKGIVPIRYNIDLERFRVFINALVFDQKRYEDVHGREDAWRMYLGLPQEYNTFAISNYRPSKSMENKYYYSIPAIENSENGKFGPRMIKGILQIMDRDSVDKLIRIDDLTEPAIMGKYTLSAGKDEKGRMFPIMIFGI